MAQAKTSGLNLGEPFFHIDFLKSVPIFRNLLINNKTEIDVSKKMLRRISNWNQSGKANWQDKVLTLTEVFYRCVLRIQR